MDVMERKYSYWVWNKLFRREFLLENNIKFPAINISEDYVFTIMCFTCAKQCVRIPFIGHHYRRNETSVTHSETTLIKYSWNLVEGVYLLDNFMQNKKFFIENPNYRYLAIEFFYKLFSDKISKYVFEGLDLNPGEMYVGNHDTVFSLNPQKTMPLASYLFVSNTIYEWLLKQQAAEIERLQKLLQDK